MFMQQNIYQHNFRNSWGKPRGFSRFNRRPSRRPKTFDPSFLVQTAANRTAETHVLQHVFDDFNFNNQLKNNIKSKGYETLTPIQDQIIPFVLEGKDVIGLARTGSGKTAAFLLPLINKVINNRNEKVLVIAPTRELAFQIETEFRDFARNLGIFSVVCIGGVSIDPQISSLRRRPNFVIGTPGRLKDLSNRGVLHFSDFGSIVLDEADRMLDMGFIPDVKFIISRLPQVRQSLFFSATLPDKMKEVANAFLKNPVTVSIESGKACINVEQIIVKVNGKPKIELLHDLLIQKGFNKVLVFGRTKWGIEKLAKALRERGFWVASIHGNKSQNQRQQALNKFKRNEIKVLVATDVASRGLDIQDVTHVINYDLPESYEDYIHRIGRTGRMDKKGIALTFVD